MKTILLAAAAALALTAPAYAGDAYVSLYGGVSYDDVINSASVDREPGFAIGGTVGTTVKSIPGLSVEGDLSFRQNEVTVSPCPSFGIKADHDTWALMANVRYAYPVLDRVAVYGLAGVGYANTQATFENIALARLEHSGLAYQLGAGASYALTDDVSVGVGYRFLQAPDLEVFGTELSDGQNHSVVAEVRIAL